ncbi:MAG: NAD(+) diphosphatase [Actinomycetota bacterium]|nr:NAD(+) diphosphatase [Actinomycetota bacterium]
MELISLGGATHDRLSARRHDQQWLADAWADPSSRVLVLAGSRLPVREQELTWVPPDEAPEGLRVLLGKAGEVVSFAVLTGEDDAGGESWASLRSVVAMLSPDQASAAVHAVGLAEWHRATRHCPRCGTALEPRGAGHVLGCSSCGAQQFPRSDPAVIMAVVDAQERILLGRQRVWPTGRWSTLAGFVEPGESLEQAVRREVAEEVGVHVGRVEYFGSQPWPLPASLMVGFIAHAETTEVEVDGDEIEEAAWYSRSELLEAARIGTVSMPASVSISRALIEHWYGEPLPGEWS